MKPQVLTSPTLVHLPHAFAEAKLTFDLPMNPRLLPAFRGAIAEKAGLENNLFHNHLTADAVNGPGVKHALQEAEPHTNVFYASGYIHRYPLIQYRIHAGKAGIVGYGAGAEALAQLLARYDGKLKICGEERNLSICEYKRSELQVKKSPTALPYHLWNWVALNAHNYESWKSLPRLADRIALLERILVNQLFAFASGIGWHIPGHTDVFITDKVQEKWLMIRGVKRLALDVKYTTNLVLPPGIALGKVVAEGYGRNVPG